IMLGVVIGFAMLVNLIVAGISGTLVPLMLDRLKIDPANASTVFLTTITDVVGFFVFLGLAALFLV
ncbi:MAG: magnesium transporter, partial [Alphaproteobacteria bacterium]